MKRKLYVWLACISLFLSIILYSVLPVSAKQTDLIMPEGIILKGQSSYMLADGVVQTNLVTNTADGNSQVRSFVASVNVSDDVKILANYGTYYKDVYNKPGKLTWKMSKTTAQADLYTKSTGGNVVVAVNGDFYNMGNGKPKGALVINGTTYHAASGKPFFAILKNGDPVIYNAGTEIASNVEQAVGGATLLVENGTVAANISPIDTKRSPCNSIGIKYDGTVIIYESDGRDDGTSVGYSLYDHARMLITLGCVKALCLDGGGSATFAAKHGASSNLELQNIPSDGKERSISSSLMVVAKSLETVQETVYSTTPLATANPTANPTVKPTSKPTSKPTATPKISKTTTKSSNTGYDNSTSSKSTTVKTNSESNQSESFVDSKKDDNNGKQNIIIKKKGLYYRIISKNKKTAAFSGVVNKKRKKVVIRSYVRSNGIKYKVIKVDQEACENNYKLKYLYLGKKIKKIGRRAFYNCTELKKVHGLSRLKKKMSFSMFYFKYVLDITS